MSCLFPRVFRAIGSRPRPAAPQILADFQGVDLEVDRSLGQRFMPRRSLRTSRAGSLSSRRPAKSTAEPGKVAFRAPPLIKINARPSDICEFANQAQTMLDFDPAATGLSRPARSGGPEPDRIANFPRLRGCPHEAAFFLLSWGPTWPARAMPATNLPPNATMS
jgi:hypothetical protein